MDSTHHPHSILIYFVSMLLGLVGMMEIKPILDFIFVSLGIIGLIISISLNIKRFLQDRHKN